MIWDWISTHYLHLLDILPFFPFVMGKVILPPFAPSQNHFRFYEDGTESGSTPIANEDTNITRTLDTDSNLHLRLLFLENNAAASAAGLDWKLQYSLNGGGYVDVTGSSSVVKSFDSASLTDGNATTNRATNGLTDPAATFDAGEIEDVDGIILDDPLAASGFTEQLWSLTCVSADVSNGNTIDFRVVYDNTGAGYTTMTYNVTPRITVSKTVTTQFIIGS